MRVCSLKQHVHYPYFCIAYLSILYVHTYVNKMFDAPASRVVFYESTSTYVILYLELTAAAVTKQYEDTRQTPSEDYTALCADADKDESLLLCQMLLITGYVFV